MTKRIWRGVDDEVYVRLDGITKTNLAEDVGAFFVEVARAIVRDHGKSLETKRSDGDVFAAICDGFKEATTN
jgi:hypothetical protein